MIFKNNASECANYTLRFPFRFGLGIDFPKLANLPIKKLGKLSFSLFRQSNFYVLEIQGFESEKSAKDYLNRLWAGMAWVSLNKCIPFSAETIFGEITYTTDPEKAAENLSKSFGLSIEGGVDGLASGDQAPIVFPSGKKIPLISCQASGSVSSQLSFDDIYPILIEGIEAPTSFVITLDSKLKLAIELYSAYDYEHTTSTRFIILIIALEALFSNKSKSAVALKLLDKWKTEIENERSNQKSNDEEDTSLEELERELFYRRTKSKRGQMRSLVKETLNEVENPRAEEFSREAVDLYDKRGELVHTGKLPPEDLDNAEKKAKKIVEMILEAKFRINSNMARECV